MAEKKKKKEHKDEIHAFAGFYRGYVKVLAVVVASIPIPVTLMRLVPVFEAQKAHFAIYSSAFCYMLLGLVFYFRHELASNFFPYYRPNYDCKNPPSRHHLRQLIMVFSPAIFVFLAAYCAYMYHDYLDFALADARGNIQENQEMPNVKELLRTVELDKIRHSEPLAITYIGMFAFAEVAIVIMALKEWYQKIRNLSDEKIVTNMDHKD